MLPSTQFWQGPGVLLHLTFLNLLHTSVTSLSRLCSVFSVSPGNHFSLPPAAGPSDPGSQDLCLCSPPFPRASTDRPASFLLDHFLWCHLVFRSPPGLKPLQRWLHGNQRGGFWEGSAKWSCSFAPNPCSPLFPSLMPQCPREESNQRSSSHQGVSD